MPVPTINSKVDFPSSQQSTSQHITNNIRAHLHHVCCLSRASSDQGKINEGRINLQCLRVVSEPFGGFRWRQGGRKVI